MGYETPNIDSIANQSALFTDWYTPIWHDLEVNVLSANDLAGIADNLRNP